MQYFNILASLCAEQAGMGLTWSQKTQKTGLLEAMVHFEVQKNIDLKHRRCANCVLYLLKRNPLPDLLLRIQNVEKSAICLGHNIYSKKSILSV